MATPMSPAAERNKQPLLDVLAPLLPASGLVLEVSSGTGQHVAHFAAALPGLRFQPTERDEDGVQLLRDALLDAPDNVLPPQVLDATANPWPDVCAGHTPVAVVNINMVHIAPWTAAEGLMRGAGQLLAPGGVLLMYGPYQRDGGHTAPSNAAFDQSLKARDPRWGVRHLEDVVALADAAGLSLEQVQPMPANNFTVVYRRR